MKKSQEGIEFRANFASRFMMDIAGRPVPSSANSCIVKQG